jgi:pantoate--beta-alanine ligase
MSSRNVRLTPENRSAAAAISRGLLSAKSLAANGVVEVSELLAAARSQILQIPEHEIDYLTVVDEDTLEPISVVTSAARLLTVVRVQGVRLLDNIAL